MKTKYWWVTYRCGDGTTMMSRTVVRCPYSVAVAENLAIMFMKEISAEDYIRLNELVGVNNE